MEGRRADVATRPTPSRSGAPADWFAGPVDRDGESRRHATCFAPKFAKAADRIRPIAAFCIRLANGDIRVATAFTCPPRPRKRRRRGEHEWLATRGHGHGYQESGDAPIGMPSRRSGGKISLGRVDAFVARLAEFFFADRSQSFAEIAFVVVKIPFEPSHVAIAFK